MFSVFALSLQARPLIVAIVGGSASGKTTLTQKLATEFGEANISVVRQDNYYLPFKQQPFDDFASINYDIPAAIDFRLLAEHLKTLRDELPISQPSYSFIKHDREETVTSTQPSKIILVDGFLLLAVPEIRPLLDAAIFLDVPEEVLWERRLKRDTTERGDTPEEVKDRYTRFVEPSLKEHVIPSKEHASFVSVYEENMPTDHDGIIQHIRRLL